jgi:seryl-tRNA synthetase
LPELTLQLDVPEDARGHVAYAAAFIHPAVAAVRVDGAAWQFRLHQPVPAAVLEAGLKTLADRFKTLPGFEPAPVFALEAPADRDNGAAAALAEARAIQEIHPGLFVYREPVSTLVRFLDHAILARFAKPFGAREESYPNCIPLGDLGKAQHFSSFPEHLHFLTHLTQDLGVLDAFAAEAKAQGHRARPHGSALSAVQLVNNPSTCYHCYAARAGTAVAGDMAVTAITKCHRFEAANHADFGRLLEFSLREVIFLGHPDYVRETRERTLALMQELATQWRLHGELLPSNDPFFTADFAAKAQQQQRMALKFEYRAAIPGQRKKLAIMSSNLHGVTFAKSFAMKREGGPLHTGCLGFGLERLALALIAQHGAEPQAWPDGLKSDYLNWRRIEPLGA